VPACSRGHESDDPDWCDVCGIALSLPPPPAPAPVPPLACPACGTELGGRFCELCGHDSAAPAPVAEPPGPPLCAPPAGPSSLASTVWRAVVRADPAWFEAVRGQNGVVATTPEFPRYASERRYVLSGDRITIGRRSRTRGTAPDIDLAELDPAVSAAHALLVARSDGWDLVDLGSTNGTTLAVEEGPIRPHTPVPLADGAVVRLGAWTTITLSTAPARSPADPAPGQSR
jgi:FHA domain-containing protein